MAEFKNTVKNDSVKDSVKDIRKADVTKQEVAKEAPKVQVPKVQAPKVEMPKEAPKTEVAKVSVISSAPKRVGEIISKLSDIVIVRDEKGNCYSLPVEKYGIYSMGTNVTF